MYHPTPKVAGMNTRRFLLAIGMLIGLVAGATPVFGAEPGEIQGSLPSAGGTAAIVWGGGDTDALVAAAAEQGCGMRSAWVFAGGKPVGFLAGAPPFVNAQFLIVFPTGGLDPGTIVIVVCGPLALTDLEPAVVVDGNVDADNVETIRLGLEMVARFLRKHFGAGLSSVANVMVFERSGEPACCFAGPTPRGLEMTLYTSHPVWIDAAASSIGDTRAKIVMHEYVHLYQAERGCYPPETPRWMAEGMAEWLAFEIAYEEGVLDRSAVTSWRRSIAIPNQPDIGQLSENETQINGSGAYDWLVEAIDLLVQSSSMQALNDYCLLRSAGDQHEVAFEKAFGLDLVAFGARFDERRAALRSSLVTVTGVLELPSGAPATGVHVYACGVAANVPACGNAVTDSTGTYVISFAAAPGPRRVQFGSTGDGCHPFGFYSDGGLVSSPSAAMIIDVSASTALRRLTLPALPTSLPDLNVCT